MSTETDFGPIQTDTEGRGALVSTYKLGPSGRHNRRGALVSTGKQIWAHPNKRLTLQADTLVSTDTYIGQSGQTQNTLY